MEERLQLVGVSDSCASTLLLVAACFGMCDTVEKFVDVHRLSFLPGTDGTAECRDEVALFEYDKVFGFEMEIVGKRLAQGRKKCQRTARIGGVKSMPWLSVVTVCTAMLWKILAAMSLSGRLRDMRFCTSVLAKTPQRAAIG